MQRRLICMAIMGLASTSSAFAGANAPKTDALLAGAAKIEFTPNAAELPVSTDVIRDPLFARAIAVKSGRTCAILIGLDHISASDAIVQRAVPRIAAATGCPARQILISATHTHSGSAGGFGRSGSPTADTVADAAIAAAKAAKGKMRPARIGYGTTQLSLNVNRDLYTSKGEWRQLPNMQGNSDKTLAVTWFVDADDIPIGVFMDYAMHPINFYLTGVISADFPGAASRWLEDMFDERAVAIFGQGSAGDQNPQYMEKTALTAIRLGLGRHPQTSAAIPWPGNASSLNGDPRSAANVAVSAEKLTAYHREIGRTGALVDAQGVLLASAVLNVMRSTPDLRDEATISSGERIVRCPARRRLDTTNPIRENGLPPYADDGTIEIKVALLRLADVYFIAINGEVYSEIGQRLKSALSDTKIVVVTLANGSAKSGYIYNDGAARNLTFQVIGSSLKPGCAEAGIIRAAVDLIGAAKNPPPAVIGGPQP